MAASMIGIIIWANIYVGTGTKIFIRNSPVSTFSEYIIFECRVTKHLPLYFLFITYLDITYTSEEETL